MRFLFSLILLGLLGVVSLDARAGHFHPVVGHRLLNPDSIQITIHVALVVTHRGSVKAARILKTECEPVSIEQVRKEILEDLTQDAIQTAKRYPNIAPKDKKTAQVVVPVVFILSPEEALK